MELTPIHRIELNFKCFYFTNSWTSWHYLPLILVPTRQSVKQRKAGLSWRNQTWEIHHQHRYPCSPYAAETANGHFPQKDLLNETYQEPYGENKGSITLQPSARSAVVSLMLNPDVHIICLSRSRGTKHNTSRTLGILTISYLWDASVSF